MNFSLRSKVWYYRCQIRLYQDPAGSNWIKINRDQDPTGSGSGVPEGPATYATLQLVGILAVLGSLMLHPSSVGGEDGATLPSADKSGTTVQVRFKKMALHFQKRKSTTSSCRKRIQHLFQWQYAVSRRQS